eukprot:m.4864 g.4864  ORF g.4864 m.4864 type:complete len:53 (+) comp4036_c0_seq1:142-300(+)
MHKLCVCMCVYVRDQEVSCVGFIISFLFFFDLFLLLKKEIVYLLCCLNVNNK